MDYGKAVMVVRSAKGLSQKELAKLIDKTPSYISRIENNERTPTPKVIDLICSRLEIPNSLFMLLGKKHNNMSKIDKSLLEEMGVRLLEIITKD